MTVTKLTVVMILFTSTIASSVIDLSGYEVEEFQSEVENHESIFVKFYSPFCIHCKSMASDFIKTARKMSENEFTVTLAEVDCTSTTGSLICQKYNVPGYPTLKLFKNGLPYKDFEGNRTSTEMTKWLKKYSVQRSKQISSFIDLDRVIEAADEPLLLAIFENYQDTLIERWERAAKKVRDQWQFRDIQFYHIFNEYSTGSTANLRSIGLSEGKTLKSPSIILVRPKWLESKFEPKSIVFNKKSKQDISEWVFRKAFGSVLHLTRDSTHTLYKPPYIVAYYDFHFKKEPKRTHLWRNRLLEKSQEYPEITFAISNSQSFRKQLRRKELEPPAGDETPLFIGYDIFGLMYPMRENFSMPAFDRFIQEYLHGLILPHIKSEEMPRKEENEVVKKVVGINFHRMVTFNPKDVFISFYAPWCKHSKELQPIWLELGKQLQDEPDLDIMKYDAVANEVPSQLEVETYPTVFFIPKTTKKAVKYTGDKNIHNFIQFLATVATQEMKGYDRKGLKLRLPSGDVKDEL